MGKSEKGDREMKHVVFFNCIKELSLAVNRMESLVARACGAPPSEPSDDTVSPIPSLAEFLGSGPSSVQDVSNRMIALLDELESNLF